MNQILLTENINNKRNNNSKNISRNNSNDIKKIIVFFSAVILVFGIAIGGVYGYRLLGNNKKEQKVSDTKLMIPELEDNQQNLENIKIIAEAGVGIDKIIYTWNDDEPIQIELNGSTEYAESIEVPVGENTFKIVVIDKNGKEVEKIATITREGQIEEVPVEINTSIIYVGNVKKVKISGQSETELNKIIYSWNGQEDVTIELNGNVSFEEEIEIPYGENDLKIKVFDIDERIKEKTEPFTREEIEINTSVVKEGNENRLKIVAISKLPIKDISYSWNNEESKKIEATEEKFVLETTIKVKRGSNTLTITATDSEGKSKTIDRKLEGLLNPLIEVYKEENKLYMKISHDKGIKSIQFYVNGATYTYDENAENYNPEKKEIEYYFDLKEGENIVIIKAISTEETEYIYRGKCNYNQ